LRCATVTTSLSMRVSFFLLACACGALRLPPLARGGALLLPRGTAVMMAKKAAVKKDGATTAALHHCPALVACASTALAPAALSSPPSLSPLSPSPASPPPWQ